MQRKIVRSPSGVKDVLVIHDYRDTEIVLPDLLYKVLHLMFEDPTAETLVPHAKMLKWMSLYRFRLPHPSRVENMLFFLAKTRFLVAETSADGHSIRLVFQAYIPPLFCELLNEYLCSCLCNDDRLSISYDVTESSLRITSLLTLTYSLEYSIF